ncbi:hypothetical protein BaRGS_00031432 [Batillaria attramentaria]|uniref:Secreted protein n=1 Tax=Batillaria attramentaria TaxID=370345 RepID=A0ABD0JQI6_9CAEN
MNCRLLFACPVIPMLAACWSDSGGKLSHVCSGGLHELGKLTYITKHADKHTTGTNKLCQTCEHYWNWGISCVTVCLSVTLVFWRQNLHRYQGIVCMGRATIHTHNLTPQHSSMVICITCPYDR